MSVADLQRRMTRAADDADWRWRHPFAVVLVLHSVAHVVGTTSAAAAIRDEESVAYLFGTLDVTSTSWLWMLAILWAVAAAGFVFAAIGVWFDLEAWQPVVTGMLIASSILCLIALPGAVMGLLLNAILFGWLVVAGPH